MKHLNEKLLLLENKVNHGDRITIMIIGLGSVGLYLLDYLVSLADPQLRLVVVGRNADKMIKDVNIVKTASAIRGQLRSEINIEYGCDLDNIQTICSVFEKYKPDFIVNSSRVYSGLKYGSISWSNLRAYGIWTPLSIRYARNLMEAYECTGCDAVTINTSYSDAVIPWLKSTGRAYFDFGSGNLNHLIPRMKFYIAKQFNIDNINEIDITLAVSHFHDVVISKEGHAEEQDILLNVRYKNEECKFDKSELLKACMIAMPVDQKRNMMNASSNFDIIYSILSSIRNHRKVKVHSPGVQGEIGGYPYIIDGTGEKVTSYFDSSVFSMDEMREANRKSIYLDGIENVKEENLFYTKELVEKVKKTFAVNLPSIVNFKDIDKIGQLIINEVIMPNL